MSESANSFFNLCDECKKKFLISGYGLISYQEGLGVSQMIFLPSPQLLSYNFIWNRRKKWEDILNLMLAKLIEPKNFIIEEQQKIFTSGWA